MESYQVKQDFLIHRESGLVLQHVEDGSAETRDPDLVSGMLTAIRDFVQDYFTRRDIAGREYRGQARSFEWEVRDLRGKMIASAPFEYG